MLNAFQAALIRHSTFTVLDQRDQTHLLNLLEGVTVITPELLLDLMYSTGPIDLTQRPQVLFRDYDECQCQDCAVFTCPNNT